ncbi:hypothetical protein [Deinococcus ficus]|uniref:hypothetical protein n=1 Tax=Deinococcus ficus TaxID=317577 RepID=UPI001749B68A|nr:hypothetical protein [Deinococcus ficus]GHF72917.1 hypothetical protein GCM10017782_08160 [Deinococcus ficus]
MNRSLTRDLQLKRTRWAEASLTLLVVALMVMVNSRPSVISQYGSWITGSLLGVILLTTGVTLWQYRIMDEFRRARVLMAWAVSGGVSFVLLTGLIVRGAVGWSGHGLPAALARDVPLPTFTLTDLYIPWTAALAAYLITTAFLYLRDQRS